MNIYPDNSNALNNVMTLALGDGSFQEWIDNYEEKYNEVQIDGFTKAPLRLGRTWQQLIASTGATPLPTYVDPESPGYEVALRSLSGATGNIPTQKQFYRFNRVLLEEQMQLIQRLGNAAVTPHMKEIFMGLLDESSEGLIKSYYNALIHQRMRVVSTGKFVISADNNPRGYQDVTIDFNVPTANFDTLTSTARWWINADRSTEGSAADPIGYMKNRVLWIRRTKHYIGRLRLEVAKNMWQDLFQHSKVRSEVGAYLFPTAANTNSQTVLPKYISDEAMTDAIAKMIGVDSIKINDSIAYVSKPGTDSDGLPDLVNVPVENFKETNIAFVPEGNIGDIQGVEPLTLGYNPEDVASFDDGRLKLTTRKEPKTHSIYIDSEFCQLCVPSVVQHMFISTVTA